MTRTTALAALLCLALAPAGTNAADRVWIAYKALCEKTSLDRFHRTPVAERDRLEVRLKLAAGSGAPAGTPPPAVTIAAKAGPIRLVPDAAGFLEVPVTDALLAEDPPVLTTMPEGQKTNVIFELRPILPTRPAFPLSDLVTALGQANALVKAQAGLFSFVVRPMRTVVLHYPPGVAQTARLVAPGLERTLTTDETGRLRIRRDEALEQAGAQVELSGLPARIELDE